MDTQAFLANKIDELQRQLSEMRQESDRYVKSVIGPIVGDNLRPYPPEVRVNVAMREIAIDNVAKQIALLEQIKQMLEVQGDKTEAHFENIKQRDEQSSKANVSLTIISSGISLLLGWLLSLFGNPATVLHFFTR